MQWNDGILDLNITVLKFGVVLALQGQNTTPLPLSADHGFTPTLESAQDEGVVQSPAEGETLHACGMAFQINSYIDRRSKHVFF